MKKQNKTKEVKKADKRLALVKNEGGTATLAGMFQKGEAFESSGFIVKSRSPMLKPGDIPTDMVVVGVLRKLIVCNSGVGEDQKQKRGVLIELVPQGAQVGAAIPATAVIQGALDMQGVGTENPTCPYLGHEIAIRRLEEKIPSKKGNNAWNFIVAISSEKV
jgi:hypothetical protein